MKKTLGRKKSRPYAMKGGAGPYVYEGVSLTLDNQYTHFAVNYNDDGTYNFNIPEKNIRFTSFCQLYEYYQENSPISCVQQTYLTTTDSALKAPSFVDILGIVLLLMGAAEEQITINLSDIKFLKEVLLMSLLVLQKGPICQVQDGQLLMSDKLKINILAKIKTLCGLQTTFPIERLEILPITSLVQPQIDTLLGLFKKVLFFYKYNVVLSSSTDLTFEVMSGSYTKALGAFGATRTVASQEFKKNITNPTNQFRNNSLLYTNAALQSALAGVVGRMPLGGRRRTRVNRSNKNRRSRTRRTRRTRRRY